MAAAAAAMPIFASYLPAKFYYHAACPYAQRVSIALLECGVVEKLTPGVHKILNSTFEVYPVKLGERPEWYKRDINPNGKVPALQLNIGSEKPRVLLESAEIARFVLRCHASPLLAEFDPMAEFDIHTVQELCRNLPSLIFNFVTADKKEAPIAAFDKSLIAIGNQLAQKQLASKSFFSILELMYMPFFHRVKLLEEYAGYRIPEFENSKLLIDWIDAGRRRQSVAATLPDSKEVFNTYNMMAKRVSELRRERSRSA